MTATRIETDTFGPIEVAADRYWGAQAQRSLGNFKIGWEKQPLSVVRALGIVKQAAARAKEAERAVIHAQEIEERMGERLPLHPHNATLEIWLDLGLVGALLLVAMLWAAVAASRRSPPGMPNRRLPQDMARTSLGYCRTMQAILTVTVPFFALILVGYLVVSRIKVAGPNEAYIITGRKGSPVKNPETGEVYLDAKRYDQAKETFAYLVRMTRRNARCTHAETGAPVLKAQHPEFEMWSTGTHAGSGVSCADCHMPYVREGAVKVSDHWLRSPLTNINQACQTCHKQSEEELKGRVVLIQNNTAELLRKAEGAIVEAIDAIVAAKAAGATDEQLKDALQFQRRATFYWDFVAAENSTGFHSPQEAARALAKAIDFARQAQLVAERAGK